MNVKLQQAIGAARVGESQKAQVLLAQILKEDTKNVHAWFLLSHLVESKEKKVAFLQKVLELEPAHQKAQERLADLLQPVAEPEPEVVESEIEEVVEETAVIALPEDQPTPVIFTEPAEDHLFQTDDSDDFFADDDEELPAWLTASSDDVLTPEELAAEVLPEFSDAVDADDLPDWLTKTNIDDWTAEKPWEQAEDLFDDIEFDDDDDDEPVAHVTKPVPVKSVIDVARELQQPDPPPLTPEKLPATKNDSWLNRILIFLIVVAAIVLIMLLYIVINSLG